MLKPLQSSAPKLLLMMLAALLPYAAKSQVNIPVTSGSTPTCLGQMYSDILWPTHVTPYMTYDPNGPNYFVNDASGEGVLGLTIFFEVRPFGYESVYDATTTGGSIAMRGIAATAINRSRTNNVDVSNYPGDPWIALATKDMSPTIWKVNKQGTGGLQSSFYNKLISILNGAQHTQDCDGLMYSFQVAIAMQDQYAALAMPEPVTLSTVNSQPGTLFFNTDGSTPSVTSSQKPYLQRIGAAYAPLYPPPSTAAWYFWTLTDAQTYGGFPAQLM